MAIDPIADELARRPPADPELAKTGVPSQPPTPPPADPELAKTGVPSQPPAPPPLTPSAFDHQQASARAAAARQQFGAGFLQELSQRPVGWSDADATTLEFQLLQAFVDIPNDVKNEVMNMVMQNSDPQSVTSMSTSKFIRHVGMTTGQMLEERAVIHAMGGVPEDEVFADAAIDTWMESGGAVRTAAMVFAEAKQNQNWFEAAFLENRDRRKEIERAVLAAGSNEDITRFNLASTSELNGLRGKRIGYEVTDTELALRFQDEGSDSYTDVLIKLDPGTHFDTPTDVIIEYLLADKGLRHTILPSSGEVPGRQNLAGAFIEATDNIIRRVEQFGAHNTEQTIADMQAQYAAAQGSAQLPNPSAEQRTADQNAMREMQNLPAVLQSQSDQSLVYLMRQYAADNPDATGLQIVQAGIGAWGQIPDEVKQAAAVETVQDLQAAAEERARTQSRLGRFLEEDIAPPTLEVLSAYDRAIHFIGIVAQDVTDMGAWKRLADAVNENGVGALSDPYVWDQIRQIVDPNINLNTAFLQSMVADIQQEGLPKAIDAYKESVLDIGTLAEYYDLDPESNLAAWVNVGASLAYDPLTYATLGGNASWNTLRRGVTTTAGAERLLSSRPIMSAAKHIVERNSVRTVPLLAQGGLSSPAIKRLTDIARETFTTKSARVAAMEEVIDVLRYELPVNGGLWIPAAPARALRRKTTMGLASMSRLAGENTKARTFIQDVLLRASARRYASLSDRSFLDDMFHMIEIRRLNDVDGYADDIIRAVDTYEAYRAGDQATALLQGRASVLRQELDDLSLSLMPDEVTQIPRVRQMVKEFDDSVKALDERLAKLPPGDATMQSTTRGQGTQQINTRAQLEQARAAAIEARDNAQAILDGVGPAYDQRLKVVAGKRDELSRVQAQIEHLQGPGRERSTLEDLIHRYMDEWADDWGVPVAVDSQGNPLAHPFVPGLPQRDWSMVVGQRGAMQGKEEAAALMPFGDLEPAMAAIGMNPQAGTTALPVSPYELLIWHSFQRNPATRATWAAIKSPAGQGVKQTMDFIQMAFAASVLFNPLTALRSSLDEVIRFYEDAGMSTDLLKSTTPGKVAGREIPGAGVGSEARAFSREAMGSVMAPRSMPWSMVLPSERGMWVHAERWVNGSLVQQPVFKAYARAVMNGADDAERRALWETWWNDEGVKLAKNTTYNHTPITAGNAYDTITNGLEVWMQGMKETPALTKAQLRQEILRAAANNTTIDWGAQMWRRLPHVPAQGAEKTTGFIDRTVRGGFEMLYGKPQGRRGSVFYDHYYDWVRGTYDEAYKGRIISEQWLLDNGLATDMYHAQYLMNQGRRSETIRHAISQQGMVLEEDLHNAAMRYANFAADDMMYSFGASSALGKKMARIYPFGRAQTDYLQWWTTKLLQPTQLVTGQQVGRVNLRLVDRMAHLAMLTDPESDERPGALTPAGVVNNFSFLPTSLDDQLLIDLGPQMGNIPAWLLASPLIQDVPGYDVARSVLEELQPNLAIYQQPYEDVFEWVAALDDALFPSGGLTIRNTVAAFYNLALMGYGYAALGFDPKLELDPAQQRSLNKWMNDRMLDASMSPWRTDYVSIGHADWLNENGLATTPDKSGGSEAMRQWEVLNQQATVAALQESTKDFMLKIAGSPQYAGSDWKYIDSMRPIGNFVDGWVDSGSLPDALRDSINLGLSLLESGEATIDDRRLLGDNVMAAVLEYATPDERAEFIARNPGFAINLVSHYYVPSISAVPEDARDAIEGDRIKTADVARARELRIRGREEGWLRYRDDNDWRYDAHMSVHRAAREYLDVIYRQGTGLDLSAQSVMVNGEKVGLAGRPDEGVPPPTVTLTPEWWAANGDWLKQIGAFTEGDNAFPEEAVVALESGMAVKFPVYRLKAAIQESKGAFSYEFDLSNELEAKMNKLGIDDRPPTALYHRLRSVEGFDMADFDASQPLSYYGSQLREDFDKAVEVGQKAAGWSSLDEWDVPYIDVVEDGPRDPVTGEKTKVTTRYSPDELRSRFRTAVTLGKLGVNGDLNPFNEKDYENSVYGRMLGPLNWEPPQPPPLNDTKAYTEIADPKLLQVVDGDTIEMPTPDGVAYVRLLGINAPERGEEGYAASRDGLAALIRNADNVAFAIWQPDTFGTGTAAFTKEDGVIVHRDRPLVIAYIDGVPLWDITQFSRTNERGVKVGGTVPDYAAILADQKERLRNYGES